MLLSSSLLLLLLIAFSSYSPCKILAKEEVVHPPHGYPLFPRDISFDKASRTALKRLRTSQRATTSREELLQELSTSGNDEKTIWTLIGYKGGALKDQINQDRALILFPFQIHASDSNSHLQDSLSSSSSSPNKLNENENAAQLLGVFDGHGKMGEEVAEFTVTELPRRLAIELQAITKLDGEMDMKVTHALVKVFQEIDQSIPTKGIGGCTASIVLRLGSKIYVANAGDSVSFVASYTEATEQVDLLFVTREDKPHLPEEYHRILEMGGKVSQPKHKDDSSRVLFIDRTTNTLAGLAMSRSIGDWDATGVISEPLVQVLDIPELLQQRVKNQSVTCAEDGPETCRQDNEKIHIFAVSATDGLMDYLTPKEIAEAFAKSFYKQSNNQTPHPHTVAEDLILKASEGWYNDMGGQYRDDITLAAARIYSENSSSDTSINKL